MLNFTLDMDFAMDIDFDVCCFYYIVFYLLLLLQYQNTFIFILRIETQMTRYLTGKHWY